MASVMIELDVYITRLRSDLRAESTEEKAIGNRRYFPHGVNSIGARAADIKLLISDFQSNNNHLSADDMLAISERLLQSAQYHEEILIAFGLINKFVKKNYDDDLLGRFEYWLERYADNWAHVDDLCLKTIFPFLMARPHLIEATQSWVYSNVSWCRRASNVVWVKFIKRKIGKTVYELDRSLVYKNCDLLLEDEDEFVQKSVGWSLKVTSQYHQQEVVEYLQKNHSKMTRPTFRYAVEKMDRATRQRLLTITR